MLGHDFVPIMTGNALVHGPSQQVSPAMKISDKRLVDIASPVTTRQKRLFSMADSITSNSPNWSEPPNCFSLQATSTSVP